MRVDPRLMTPPAATASAPRAASGQRFTVRGQESASQAKAPVPAAPLATVDALLALQGGEDPAERMRRSVKRGQSLLGALDRLKAAILSGRVSGAELQQLSAQMAERRDPSGDPKLDDLLAHIELRAQVELAKIARAGR